MKIPLISRLLEKRQRTSDLTNPKQWLMDALGVRKSSTGVNVNETTAMQFGAVYACVRIIAETIASLPLNIYRRLGDDRREKATDHPLFDKLHNKPNEDMSSFNWRETVMYYLLLRGNQFNQVIKTRGGDIAQIYPLAHDKMKVEIKGGKLVYTYDGSEMDKEKILHFVGLSSNGVIGKSPLTLAREAIGLGIALEEFGSRFFENSTNVGGVAQHPGKLGEEAYHNLKKSLAEEYQGLGKSHKLLILEEGMTYERVSIPPNDAQFLESRKFQLEEIARIFRVPLHLLQNLDRATFNNIEHLGISFVIYTLLPWIRRIEQAINITLFSEAERRQYFAEFVVDGLLRGDHKSRWEAYAIARQNGLMNANEIRALENMNPLEGNQGSIYTIQLNMQDLKNVGKISVKDEPAQEQNTRAIDTEKRQKQMRSATARARMAKAYEGLFENITTRLIKRERTDVMKLAKKAFGQNDMTLFDQKLKEYYENHKGFVAEQTHGAMVDLSNAVTAEIKAEVDYSGDVDTNQFMNEYQDTFNGRYTTKHYGRLSNVASRAIQDKKDPIEELDAEFDHWEESYPNQVATEETVRISGAISRFAYGAVGVKKLMWVNTGDKSCPYCESLNGKIVGIEQPFIPAGTNLEPEGVANPMKISGPKFHPPVHLGCVCTITSSS